MNAVECGVRELEFKLGLNSRLYGLELLSIESIMTGRNRDVRGTHGLESSECSWTESLYTRAEHRASSTTATAIRVKVGYRLEVVH
jgi:hypothetical protein